MLQGVFRLYDIDDVEAFTARIIERMNGDLSYHDKEELHAYLVTTAWELSLRFAPEKTSGKGFSAYCGRTLPLRVTDWKRKKYGRTKWTWTGKNYVKPRPIVLSLDHDIAEEHR